jgi:hypothetical protein
LLDAEDRFDDCHFAESGEMKAAKAWAELLLPPAMRVGVPSPLYQTAR